MPLFKYILVNGQHVSIVNDTITFEIKLKFEYLSPTYHHRLFTINDGDAIVKNKNLTLFQLQQLKLLKHQQPLKKLKELYILFIKIEVKEGDLEKLISLCHGFEGKELSIELDKIITIRTKQDSLIPAAKIYSDVLLDLFNDNIKFIFEHEEFRPCVPLFQPTKRITDTDEVKLTKNKNADLRITSVSFIHTNRNRKVLEFTKVDLQKHFTSSSETDETNAKKSLLNKEEPSSGRCCSII